MRAANGQAVAESETARVTREAETARMKALSESERLQREKNEQALQASSEAARMKRDSDARLAVVSADADRQKADSDARLAVVSADADRQKADSDARMSAAGTEADRLKRENDAERANSQADLDNAAKMTAQLQTEKMELRTLLLSQFNAILQTRDTTRGLIVNMSDVLFDTGKSTLRPLAREKLAKVAGIVSGHPGLRLDVEGYTDSVGGDSYNQQLSEDRGASVRSYLMQEGMPATSVAARGFGKSQPVASNETVEGRQQNRRVELVISGKVIGTEIGTPIGMPMAAR
jgi:outer membrane protein OmpA-like peptidoglycan-associated protein